MCVCVKGSQLCDSLQPEGLWPTRLLSPWDSPGRNTGMGCHDLLQGIFPTQGSNPGLPHCRRILYHLSHQGSPFLYWMYRIYTCDIWIYHIFFIHSHFDRHWAISTFWLLWIMLQWAFIYESCVKISVCVCFISAWYKSRSRIAGSYEKVKRN